MSESFYTDDHEELRKVVRTYVEREVTPNLARWERQRLVDREAWLAAGRQGLLGARIPEEYGGAGLDDYRVRCVISEEMAKVGATSPALGFALNDDIVLPYLLRLGTEEQKRRWLPGFCTGETIAAIAMTEPGAGSDLRGMRATATRDGDEWVINGAKTFITNGIQADLVIVAAQTQVDGAPAGLSLFVVESGTPGFTRGRKLDKIGQHAQDTAELFFDDVRVPAENLLGTEGAGMRHLVSNLPSERLSIAWYGLAMAEAALEWTLAYTRERTAFGKPILDFQATRFRLAELVTEVEVTRSHLEKLVHRYNAGELDVVDAAKAKWWATETQKKVIDSCLQLFGGYGYMMEYPIARAFIDSRVQTIYGGTTEIMKEIIGRSLAGPERGRPAAESAGS
ncbi:acyl-CoA dehydrogenase family protein [Thermopolyspora sp. NPDC052614]|uniref:acyl-CoA dehydrogenase family protein n=1 Tax=Thermopolyspora sp. NPDC052614 TaxID=3155682 RepID=UPI003437BD42